jgi:hypothetical protein
MKIFLLLCLFLNTAWADDAYPGLRVDVKRDGRTYVYSARFATPLSKCLAYRYLTDYEAKKALPGVVNLSVQRESANTVRVALVADEPVLFFSVRIDSVLEYTEKPFEGISFKQRTGNANVFKGKWSIEPSRQGSTLKYKGVWEPDTLVPLIVLDQFAEQILTEKFTAIAEQAEKYQGVRPVGCAD